MIQILSVWDLVDFFFIWGIIGTIVEGTKFDNKEETKMWVEYFFKLNIKKFIGWVANFNELINSMNSVTNKYIMRF